MAVYTAKYCDHRKRSRRLRQPKPHLSNSRCSRSFRFDKWQPSPQWFAYCVAHFFDAVSIRVTRAITPLADGRSTDA
jgi:hypothetical protein